MGIMGLLKFALMCIDFLAWPVIALGYPLFSTIRAIETSSQYHLKKLAKYWTLFALISLLEFALVKIIEWIPFWSSLKLIATVWLVVPRFRGACHAYRRLITLCLFADVHSVIDRWSVGFQAVIDRFYKPEEEKLLKTESFGDVVEKYIKENGAEALEKLIASKIQLESKEHDHSQRNTAVPEPEEKNAAAMLEQLKEPDAVQKDHETLVATEKTASTEARPMKEPDAVQKDNETLEATEKTASAEAKPVQNAEPSTNGWTPKQTEAASEVKETKNVQQEWTCALCQVTATSEKMLKDHLRGRKHKSKIESLKKSKLDEESTASSPSAAGKSSAESVKGKGKAKEGSQQQSWKKTEEKVQSQVPSDQQNQRKPKQNGAANQQFKLWCTVCHVKLLSDVDLAAHLRGKRHTSNVQNL